MIRKDPLRAYKPNSVSRQVGTAIISLSPTLTNGIKRPTHFVFPHSREVERTTLLSAESGDAELMWSCSE
jgi:hypothetical protein